jgi:hypothetical protein
MRRKSVPEKEPATLIVKNIRRATRRHFSAEDKIRISTGRLARRGQYRRALPIGATAGGASSSSRPGL